MSRLFLLCFLIGLSVLPAYAQGVQRDADTFARLPVQHEGRIKPVESMARTTLSRLSGAETITGLSASQWLMEVVFDPARAMTRPVIKITNHRLRDLLELEARDTGYYSYNEVAPALELKQSQLNTALSTPPEDLDDVQKKLLKLQQKTSDYDDLLNSLSLFLPLNISVPDDAPDYLEDYQGGRLNYLDLLKFRERLDRDVEAFINPEQIDNLNNMSPRQAALARLFMVRMELQKSAQGASMLRVIPAQNEVWVTPWQVMRDNTLTQGNGLFGQWKELSAAYHQSDAENWNQQLQKVQKSSYAALDESDLYKLEVEYIYHQVQPVVICLALTILAALMLLIGKWRRHHKLKIVAALPLAGAFLVNILMIAARIFILGRPPVGTLYESILFVAMIVLGVGLLMTWRQKDTLFLWVGAIAGAFLYQLSFVHAGEGDSFLKLGAVLNTNFWLATHVLCITAGYAFCILTSVLAHIWLIYGSKGRGMFRTLHSLALVSLLLTVGGTVLGGIWADQSWGRFWGWDPKENGALLICLWLIWTLHGRIASALSEFSFVMALAGLSIVVALSWFGVNLLSVGLHSYGFTDMAAWSLFGLIAFEAVFFGYCIFQRQRRPS